jgi:SAM-dependent methyltransferase
VSQYAGLAGVWATDAALAYGPLARHLVEHAPRILRGAVALDAGAGSGLAGEQLRARGAHVVSADREFDMASHVAHPAVAADITALPFRAGCFDLVVAAFVINHLPDPVSGLAELRRVVRAHGTVLVSTFSTERAAAKGAVDGVAAAYGFAPPEWYAALQASAQVVGTAPGLDRALEASGLTHREVTEEAVDIGLADPNDVVRYRLATPHLHAFVSQLAVDVRRGLVADAVEAVRRTGERFAPVVVEAVARL